MQLSFSTKLYIPQLRPKLVKRSRLTTKLANAQTGYTRLTLVIAPAGFGKSTLLSEWAAQAPFPVAWLSIDQNDNEPVRFFSYLAAALQQATNQPFFDKGELPNAESLLEKIIELFRSAKLEVGLVLDDYHLVNSAVVHNFIASLLEYFPPGLHLLIASRSEPPLPLARLRARGQLLELGVAELGFTQAESVTFLQQTMGLDLPPEIVILLEDRTEGWAAGLQLAALSLQNAPNQTLLRAAQDFTGRQRYILDYLAEEVLQHQPPEVEAFLLDTAHLEKLNAELCQAVTGRSDSRLLLDKVEQANLFLIPLDNDRQWYRYHHLFADFLRARQNLQTLPARHLAASCWYEQHDFIVEALEHAAAAQDFEQLGRLLAKNAQLLLMSGEFTLLANLLDMLPPASLTAFPRLLVIYGWIYTLQGQISRAAQSLAQAEAVYQQTGASLTEVLALHTILAAFHLDMPRLAELADQTLASLVEQDDLFLRSLVIWSKSFSYVLSGDLETAIKTLEEALPLARQAGNILVMIQGQCQLAELKVIQGRLHEAAQLYRQALHLAQSEFTSKHIQGSFAGLPCMGLGEIQREWNLLDQAESNLTRGLELAESAGNLTTFDGWISLARLKRAKGDFAQALAFVGQAEEIFNTTDFEALRLIVPTYRVRFWLAMGELKAARQWLKDNDIKLAKQIIYPFWPLYTSCVRIFIACDETATATEWLASMQESAAVGQWQGWLLEINLLQALNLQAQGQLPEAVALLEEILVQAEPENYVRLFADEGLPLANLLNVLLKQRQTNPTLPAGAASTKYILNLLSLASGTLAPANPTPSAPISAVLSEQELKVLRLLAAGLSNPEIAAELVIATSTVKTHVLHIFAKLEVRNRVHATERARELGFL